jgi:transcription antitermination factor NusG
MKESPAPPSETLFFDPSAISQKGWSYYAARTRPRREKQLKLALDRAGAAAYLPTYFTEKERRAGGHRIRKYTSELVLFPGYVFAALPTPLKSLPVVAGKVASWIEVKEPERKHFLKTLEALRNALSMQISLIPYEGLKPGKAVLLASGPLRGSEGKIVEHRGQLLFAVEIELLGRGVLMEIEASSLKTVD